VNSPLVQLEHVSLAFGDRRVLDDVTFELRAGEFTGLIGSNGVGKTTMLRVLLGLLRPSTGHVHYGEIDGRPIAIGYVPQRLSIDPDVPVRARDFVALGLEGRRWRPAQRKAARVLVDEYLAAVEATSCADQRLGALSGGELQRVLIAHALISRPAVLVLDEPLANLDPHSVQEIVQLLHSVATERNIAILLSAHEMNALLPVMDRIVYLTNGKAASGPTEEVIRADVLSELYGHHVDVLRLHGRVLVVAEPSAATDRLPSHETLDLG
jgi:zinc/manganese transport system ATP-binding protein